MKLKRLKIKGLFDRFNYDIPLDNEEGVTILTGPNGYGKTKILNIIDSFFNRKFYFFQNLIFKKIEFVIENEYFIKIENNNKNNIEIKITLFQFEKPIESFIYTKKNEADFKKALEKHTPFEELEDDTWMHFETGETIPLEDVIENYGQLIPQKILTTKIISVKENPELYKIFKNFETHLVREQRLLSYKTALNKTRETGTLKIEYAINNYAKRLKELIRIGTQEYFKITQDLDSTFPTRLLNENNRISQEDYQMRFEKLKAKQAKLAKYGIINITRENASYIDENAKVLLVYLNDAEKKLNVFDELVKKLELFTAILEEARLSNKYIKVDKDKGFSLYTEANFELNLADLSSGEQHYIILFNELIFNSNENSLVLIDEPEISLHVAWQRDFLDNIFKINQLQKNNVIIATHSPSIIAYNRDIAYDLFSAQHNEIEKEVEV